MKKALITLFLAAVLGSAVSVGSAAARPGRCGLFPADGCSSPLGSTTAASGASAVTLPPIKCTLSYCWRN